LGWRRKCLIQSLSKVKDEKDKMFKENLIYKKFISIIWRSKTCHERVNQPNKLTEYEIPTDSSKYNRIIEDFDPVILFDEEYERDEAI
jgi:hypothetical protein